mmetsp:Transcript_112564/g.220656  ORF Transcript_112564/g.220656 Transcript_112564/m.220656 type:complete len:184 (+) Transcript_112564:57-608(+)
MVSRMRILGSGRKLSMQLSVLRRPFSRKAQTVGLIATNTESAEKYPWVEEKDPNGSGKTYYWNTITNETTHLGSGKPIHWIEVADPNGSSQTYWWCPDTDQTTPLGSPRPALFPLQASVTVVHTGGVRPIRPFTTDVGVDAYRPNNQTPQMEQPSLGKTMMVYATFGAGLTFAMVAVRAILGF